jgi:hypothetical protein
MQPNAGPVRLTTLDTTSGSGRGGGSGSGTSSADNGIGGGRVGRGGGGRGAATGPGRAAAPEGEVAAAPQGGGRGGRGGADATAAPRVLLQFPNDPNDLLLSGVLAGGEALAGRAVAIDSPIGRGHVVMFANRPFWRWETQGSFFLAFNAILNWNDLDAGRAPARSAPATRQEQ